MVEDGQITKMEEEILDEADVCLDCRGLFLVPGMIDMHCHVREAQDSNIKKQLKQEREVQ